MYDVDNVVKDYLAVIEEKDNEIVSLTKENNVHRLRIDDLEHKIRALAQEDSITTSQNERLRQQLQSALDTVKRTERRQTEVEMCLTDIAAALSAAPNQLCPNFNKSASVASTPSSTNPPNNVTAGAGTLLLHDPSSMPVDMSHLCLVLNDAIGELISQLNERDDELAFLRSQQQLSNKRESDGVVQYTEHMLRRAIQEEERVELALISSAFLHQAREASLKSSLMAILHSIPNSLNYHRCDDDKRKRRPRFTVDNNVGTPDSSDAEGECYDDDDFDSAATDNSSAADVACDGHKMERLRTGCSDGGNHFRWQDSTHQIAGTLKAAVSHLTVLYEGAASDARQFAVRMNQAQRQNSDISLARDATELEQRFLRRAVQSYEHFCTGCWDASLELSGNLVEYCREQQRVLDEKEDELHSASQVLSELKSMVWQLQHSSAEVCKQQSRDYHAQQQEKEQECQALVDENERLKGRIVSVQTSQMQLRLRAKSLSTKLEDSGSAHEKLRADLEKTQEQLQRARAERDAGVTAAKRQTAALESFQRDTEVQLSELRAQTQQNIAYVHELQRQLDARTQEAADLLDQLQTQKEENTALHLRHQELADRLAGSEHSVQQLRDHIAVQEKAVAGTHENYTALREKADAYAQHVEALKRQLLRFNDKLVEKDAELERLHAENERSLEGGKIESSIMSAELATERKSNEQLKHELMEKGALWEIETRRVLEENNSLCRRIRDLELACELSVRHINELREELCRRSTRH